jgi:hypothetical protein
MSQHARATSECGNLATNLDATLTALYQGLFEKSSDCGHLTQRQTVSKLRFWSMRALQTIDFVRPHFRKIDFSHSLALHTEARQARGAEGVRYAACQSARTVEPPENARILLANSEVPNYCITHTFLEGQEDLGSLFKKPRLGASK